VMAERHMPLAIPIWRLYREFLVFGQRRQQSETLCEVWF